MGEGCAAPNGWFLGGGGGLFLGLPSLYFSVNYLLLFALKTPRTETLKRSDLKAFVFFINFFFLITTIKRWRLFCNTLTLRDGEGERVRGGERDSSNGGGDNVFERLVMMRSTLLLIFIIIIFFSQPLRSDGAWFNRVSAVETELATAAVGQRLNVTRGEAS